MKTTKILMILLVLAVLLVCFEQQTQATPMGTAFTYEGHLYDANNPAEGLYDFQFRLYDANSNGNQVDSNANKPDVDVFDGYFTVEVDFGNVFDGNAVWLDIGVRPGELEDPNDYTLLSPRQEITPTPYALYAKTVLGDNDWQISGSNIYSAVSGQVGIGTDSPNRKLSVIGYVRSAFDSDETEYVEIYHGGLNALVNWYGDGNLDFRYGGSTLVTIQQDGYVGIGTTSPAAYLHVSPSPGTAGDEILQAYSPAEASYISNDVAVIQVGPSTYTGTVLKVQSRASNNSGYGLLHVQNGLGSTPSSKFYIRGDGKVGIGTTSPGAKLEVNGQVKITGGSPGANKVLTSNESGLASWKPLPAGGDSDWTINGNDMYSAVSGKVGIGDSSPDAKLDILNAGSGASFRVDDSSDGDTTPFIIDASGKVGIGTAAPGKDLEISNTGGPTIRLSRPGFGSADILWDGTRFRINNGDIGIGTINPSNETKVHIQTETDGELGILIVDSAATSGSEIGLHATNSQYASLVKNAFISGANWERFDTLCGAFLQEISPAGDVRFKVANPSLNPISWNEALTLKSDGKVGIGKDPAWELDVVGHINSNQSYKLDGDTVLSNKGIAADNIFVGKDAGTLNSANYNTGIGSGALNSNVGGYYNTAVGGNALHDTTTSGNDNVAVGYNAGSNNTTGSGNVFLGYQAGYNETGSDKLYIANSSSNPPLIYGDFSTGSIGIGTNNPGMAKLAVMGGKVGIGTINPQGSLDVHSGNSATDSLYVRSSPSRAWGGIIHHQSSTYGWQAISEYTSMTSQGKLKYHYVNRTDPNTKIIENVLVLKANGNVGIGVADPGYAIDVNGTANLRGIAAAAGSNYVHVGSGGLLRKTTSSRKYKTNIRDLDIDPTTVLQLRPVRYQCKVTGNKDIGLIAEEVDEVAKDLVIHNEDGSCEAVKYDRIGLYLLGVVKQLKTENSQLKQRLEALEQTVNKLVVSKGVQL